MNKLHVIFILLLCSVLQGCAFYMFGPHVSVKIVSCDYTNNKERVLIERHKHTYEKHPGAIMMGEMAGQIPLKTDYILLEYDTGQKSEHPVSRKNLFTIGKPWQNLLAYLVSGKDLLLHTYSEDLHNSPTINIFSMQEGRIIKKLISDDTFFGDWSDDRSKIYYFKSGELHFFDLDTMSEEVLPQKAYDLLKKNRSYEDKSWLGSTNRKDIFLLKKEDGRCVLFNIISGDVLSQLKVDHLERIRSVIYTDDETYILTANMTSMAAVRNIQGDIINKLKFEDNNASSYDWSVDAENHKVYFVRYIDESFTTRIAYGYLEGIVWDFINNTTETFTHKLK